MKKVERVKKAINQEIPDKVPKGELLIDKGFIKEFFGKDKKDSLFLQEEIEFLEALDMDLVSLQPKSIFIEGRDPWGRKKSPLGTWEPTFKTVEDIDQYEVSAIDRFDFSEIQQWSQETDFFVFAVIGGGFDYASSLFEFIDFLMFTKKDSKRIAQLMDKLTAFNAKLAKAAIEAGAHGVIIGDDIAYNKGTLLNPKTLREILFPYLKRQVAEIKQYQVPVFFHADGNLNAVLEDIVEMGFDGLHSLQPSAGMNIKEIKAKFGDKLCLMGNMDLDYLLPLGTKEEISEAVKTTVETAKIGGGYIFGTCGALSEGLPVDNVKALFKEAKLHGGY